MQNDYLALISSGIYKCNGIVSHGVPRGQGSHPTTKNRHDEC